MTPTYVTNKPLDQDQLQQFIIELLEKDLIPSNPALDNIIKTYNEFEKQPNRTIKNLKYDIELGKVVSGDIYRLNFALSHIAVMPDRQELYFIMDNSKIICVYRYSESVSGEELFLYLTSILDRYDIIPLFNPAEEELLEIAGVPELQ